MKEILERNINKYAVERENPEGEQNDLKDRLTRDREEQRINKMTVSQWKQNQKKIKAERRREPVIGRAL